MNARSLLQSILWPNAFSFKNASVTVTVHLIIPTRQHLLGIGSHRILLQSGIVVLSSMPDGPNRKPNL